MKAQGILHALTPPRWGLAVALAVAAALALALGHGLGFRWDPFHMAARRLAAAETRAAAAESDLAARRLEVEGAAEQARRVDSHHQQAVSVARATDRTETRARSAYDASIPLDPARADRLREHDRQLCELSPAVCAAASAGPARGGGDALPAGPAA